MPLRFTFRQLEYFVAVGNAGSITLASEQINISSPSISAAISQLEQEFNVQLFVRQHAQGLSLTPAGQRFLKEAKLLLDQAHALHDVASDISGGVSGPLTLGCLITVAPNVLPGLRKGFERAYPEAELGQREAHQADLLALLMHAEIDVAITYDLHLPREVAFEPLVPLPPYALFSDTDPAAAADAVRLEDLAGRPMVLLDLPLSRDYFLSLFQDRSLKPLIAERTKDMTMMRSLVANGYGYGLANLPLKSDRAVDGKPIRMRRLDDVDRPLSLGLATVRDARKTGILTAFEAYCREALADGQIAGTACPE